MDDVTFSAESRSLWVMSYVIGGFVIGDEDCSCYVKISSKEFQN